MNLPTEIFGNVAVVHTPEELGSEQIGPFHAFLAGLSQVAVVLDLDGSELLDSAGLTALVDLQERLRIAQGDLKIATANPINRKILELTRLDQQLEVFESVVDAVKSFR
ncbi:MAG TPA: STAS domain-containing protein [Pirellulales bacterium]|jgi:anti-anti-sigma factor|nr:STAS domain-containing protein [Pirellulales bacterium]